VLIKLADTDFYFGTRIWDLTPVQAEL